MRILLLISIFTSLYSFADESPMRSQTLFKEDKSLDQSLEKLQRALEKRPDQSDWLLNSYWKELKTKVWSNSHRNVAIELSNKLNLNLQFSEPGSSPLATMEIRKICETLGLDSQGFEILANGLPATEDDLQIDQVHWLAYSPQLPPVVFWGSWKDFQGFLKSKIHLQEKLVLKKYLPEKSGVTESLWPAKSDSKFSPEKRNLILVGILGVLAYSLKDKKLVLRH